MRSRPPFFAIAHAGLNTDDAAVADRPSAMLATMKSRRPIRPDAAAARSRSSLSTASRSEIPVIGSLVSHPADFLVMDASPEGLVVTTWMSADDAGHGSYGLIRANPGRNDGARSAAARSIPE
ncbi:MAG: hypothetical protein OXC65_11540 [Thiotrichales bacterium]|nr:hypothetical protein [Thiotrichales bacterium]